MLLVRFELRMVLSSGTERTPAMTRPMTKAQLSLMAAGWQNHHDDSFVRSLINTVVLGTGIGTFIATLILISDTFGLFTLARSQSDPIATAFAFVASGVMIFTPLSLAVAVGLAGRAK
jgi:hypothetical protein